MDKGRIFDLDGVLVFTDKLHYKAWKKRADDEGIYFDEKINKACPPKKAEAGKGIHNQENDYEMEI